jgi:hypothetical protein
MHALCFLALLIGPPSVPAAAPISYSMVLYSEINSQIFAPCALYGPWISVCATIFRSDGPPVGAGLPVAFNVPCCNAILDNGSQSKTVNTNGNGQAWVAVQCTDMAPATITAKWSMSMVGVLAQASIDTSPMTGTCNLTTTTPVTQGWRLPANPNSITWGYLGSTTMLMGQVTTSFTVWHAATPQLTFVGPRPSTETWDIGFWDICSTESWFGKTFPSADPRVATIKFNRTAFDGNPNAVGECFSAYPPYPARHHLFDTAAHEIGHALGLDHNLTDEGSLMYDTLFNFFICGIAGPTQDEINAINSLYH